MVFGLCGCGRRRGLGGDAPEDHGSGVLNGFQTFAEKVGVSVPKLDVVGGCGSGAKTDGLANHKGHGFGFGFADLFGGEGAALAAMEHLVADLMDERGKFLGGLHAQQQRDLSAVGQALGGANPLGIIQLDALRCDKLHQPFAVATHVALRLR